MGNFTTVGFTYKYKYLGTYGAYTDLQYKYRAANGLAVSKDINYSYRGSDTDKNDKVIGWRSDYTQLVASNYQPWNVIRNCANSTGQYLLNSLLLGIDTVNEYWKKSRKELFLDTANVNQPYLLNRIDLSDSIDIFKPNNKQLLLNAGFKEQSLSRYNLPENWTDKFSYTSGVVELTDIDSLSIGKAVRFYIGTNEKGYLGQKLTIFIPAKSYVTASIWFKLPYLSSLSSNVKISLSIRTTLPDGTVKTDLKQLSKFTENSWNHESITIQPTQDITRVEYSIEISSTDSLYTECFFACPQLELSDHPTEFIVGPLDAPEFLKYYGQFTNDSLSVDIYYTGSHMFTGSGITGNIEHRIPTYSVNEKGVFLYDLIPTRVYVDPISGSLNTTLVSNKINGFNTTIEGETSEKGWDIVKTGSDRNKLFTYRWPFQDDIINTYYIADRNVYQSTIRADNFIDQTDLYHKYTVSSTSSFMTGNSYNLNIEAITIYNNLIYAICSETYKNKTNRILKIINPKTEYNVPYLETINEFMVHNDPITGAASAVSYIDSITDSLYISLTGNSLLYSGELVTLYRDYYYIDKDSRSVFIREEYTGNSEKVIIS